MLVGFDHITRLLRGGGGIKSFGCVNPKRIPPAASMKAHLRTEITLLQLRGRKRLGWIKAEVNFLATEKIIFILISCFHCTFYGLKLVML
jgi:hypothetical protein